MKSPGKTFRIGFLLLGAVVLGIGLLLVLGLGSWFEPQMSLNTAVAESVQGLSVGAPVKYKGVPIGTVKRITMQLDDKLVLIDMNIKLDVFSRRGERGGGGARKAAFQAFIRREIESGLRCRIEYTGITGLRYVELDYYDPNRQERLLPAPEPQPSDSLYVPAVRSLIKDLLNSLALSMDRIARIRFEEISDGLTRTIGEVARIIGDPEIKSTIRHMEEMAINLDRTTAGVSQVFTEERLEKIVSAADENLASIRRLTEQLSTDFQAVNLPETGADVRTAVQAVQRAAEGIAASRSEITRVVVQMETVMRSITELTQYLRDDPGSLLRGKAPRME